MKYVIVIAVLACFTYSVYSQVLDPGFPQIPDLSQVPDPDVDPDVLKCVNEKLQKCKTICDPDYMLKTFRNETTDSTRNYCCEMSRCYYCLRKVGPASVSKCGPGALTLFQSKEKNMEAALENNGCNESSGSASYMNSVKCSYHFYFKDPEVLCGTEKLQKCKTICDPDYMFKKFKNGTVDWTRNYCCEYSRCAHCLTKKVGLDTCGPSSKELIEEDFDNMFRVKWCTLSLRYPSAECYYHYHSQVDTDATNCIGEKLQKFCNKTCDTGFLFEKNYGGWQLRVNWTSNHCCQISRCNNCVTKNVGACGSAGKQFIEQDIENFETVFKTNNCTESRRHPSAKCNYYFYTAWFYVVPLLILAVVVGIVFVVLKKRRS